MDRRTPAVALFALAACVSRPLDPVDDGSSGAGETAPDTSQGPTSAPPDPTTGQASTTVDPPPATSTSASTSTTSTTDPPDPSTTLPPDTTTPPPDVTSAPPFCGDFNCDPDEDCGGCPDDCGPCPLPAGIARGCHHGWSGGSPVVGTTVLGPFTGKTAFFAWTGFGDQGWAELDLVLFDESVDTVAATMNGLDAASSPYAQIETNFPWGQWVQTGLVFAQVQVGDQFVGVQIEVTVTELAGTWDVFDPADPARVIGEIKRTDPNDPTGFEGPFDAAFCDRFTIFVIPE